MLSFQTDTLIGSPNLFFIPVTEICRAVTPVCSCVTMLYSLGSHIDKNTTRSTILRAESQTNLYNFWTVRSVTLVCPSRLFLVRDCLQWLHCAREKLFDTDTTLLVRQPPKFGVEVSDKCFVSFSQRVLKFIFSGSFINNFSHKSPLVLRCPV